MHNDLSCDVSTCALCCVQAQTVSDNLYLISLNNVSSEFGIQVS